MKINKILTLLFVIVFTIAGFTQNNAEVKQDGVYFTTVKDTAKNEKFVVYLFFQDVETAYVYKSDKKLSVEEIAAVKADLPSVKRKGVFKVYPDHKMVIRTNNHKDVKAHNAKPAYATLTGKIGEGNTLILNYTEDQLIVKNLVFEFQ